MCFIILDYNTINPVWSFLNSAFFASVVGTGLGALGGAWSASKIADKKLTGAINKNAHEILNYTIVLLSDLISLKLNNFYPEYKKYNTDMIDFITLKNKKCGKVRFNYINKNISKQDFGVDHIINLSKSWVLTADKIQYLTEIRVYNNQINFLIDESSNVLNHIESILHRKISEDFSDEEKNKQKSDNTEEAARMYYGFRLKDGSLYTKYKDIVYGNNLYINKSICNCFFLIDSIITEFKNDPKFNVKFDNNIKRIPLIFFWDIKRTCPKFSNKFEEIRKFRIS